MDENPYASPLSEPSDEHEFRPDLVSSWIWWVMRGGNMPAKRDLITGDFILAPPLLARAFLASGFGGPIAMAVIAVVNPPNPRDWWAPWAGGVFFLLLGGGMAILLNESVRISAERITKLGRFFRQRTIAWGDIVSVILDPYGRITLLSASGKRVRLVADLSGIADFPNLLEQYLPEQVRRECEENLARYRRFLRV